MKWILTTLGFLIIALSFGCSETSTEPDSRGEEPLSTLKSPHPEPTEVILWSGSQFVMKANGEIWQLFYNSSQSTGDWAFVTGPELLPVPVSEIAFLGERGISPAIVARSGEGFVFDRGRFVSIGFPE